MPSEWLIKGRDAAARGGQAPPDAASRRTAVQAMGREASPAAAAGAAQEKDILRRVRQRLVDERILELPDGEMEDAARRVVLQETAALGRAAREAILRAALQGLRGGLGPLQPYMDDPDVVEIMVNAPDRVYVERRGRLERVPVQFYDDEDVRQLVENAVGRVGRRFDLNEPMVDARLPSGARLNAVRPPLALAGTAVTIRKFPHPFTFGELVALGAIPDGGDGGFDVASALRWAVRNRRNIVISGGTSSGKTSLLNALTGLIPEHERLVVIEDSAELQPQQEHVVRLEARPPNIEGKGEITIRDLVRNALRMRPDRIIVGESRGGEAFDLLVAMNTGHDGSLTTVHANSPRDTLTRLESMVLMAGMDIPLLAIRRMVASAVQLILHVERSLEPDPRDQEQLRVVRRVTHLTAVHGLDAAGEYRIKHLHERPVERRIAADVPNWARPWFES